MIWETIIGLEVHVQLKTHSKLFSNASTQYGALPNTQANYIDAGFPGVLPVLNRQVLIMAIQFGLAIQAKIQDYSYFERKNYFYPDLPKGYQISQFQRPIIIDGSLPIKTDNGLIKSIHIERAHLEEDAGKSIHDHHAQYTGIDLNRAGMPLLEVVTSPCMHSAHEAIAYLKTLHQLVRFLGICDGNMQEGSFRCDVNISLRPKGCDTLGTRTEIKNLNSFKYIEKAIQYEQLRHQDALELQIPLQQETRLYSPNTNSTYVMRSKESENDYRYFPDPDLLPIHLSETLVEEAKANLLPLPQVLSQQLAKQYSLEDKDIEFLLSSPATLAFFKEVHKNTSAPVMLILNWLKGQYSALLNELGTSFESPPISALQLAKLLDHLANESLTVKMAKDIFLKLMACKDPIDEIITNCRFSLNEYSKESLETLVNQIMTKYPQQTSDFLSGKEQLYGFFVGQVMKETKGQADPGLVNKLVKQYLAGLIKS